MGGLQALWLQRVLTGQISLPLPETRDQDIESQKEWKRSWMPAKGDRAAILQLHKMKYHDQLCKDMGLKHKRKGWNIFAECFAPYSAADYVGLFQCREQRRDGPTLLGCKDRKESENSSVAKAKA